MESPTACVDGFEYWSTFSGKNYVLAEQLYYKGYSEKLKSESNTVRLECPMKA
ncbi:MAG: hypothetical protein O8C68_01570 [Candidatus Methanoperedens sp.]|nr:hypothetical protein [Candidatus Methanoperedens sp.]MCZ7394490.1 hypothetical protein [Candidatus Methanoperedens sp.]